MEQTKINTNETEFKIIKDKKDEPDLQSAQLFVGGYVECIQFPNGDLLLVNEEGKLMNILSCLIASSFVSIIDSPLNLFFLSSVFSVVIIILSCYVWDIILIPYIVNL